MGGALIFQGANSGKSPKKQVDINNRLLTIGEQVISFERYNQILGNVVQYTNPNNEKLSPFQVEFLQLQAMNVLVEEVVFYNGATEAAITLEKSEIEEGYFTFLSENNLKDKKELKKLLKERKIPFSEFEKSFEKQLLINNFKALLMANVGVDPSSDSALAQLDLQIISLTSTKETLAEKIDLANEVYEKLQDGLSFSDAVIVYSESKDPNIKENKGIIKGISYGQLPEKIENIAFQTDVNSISKPVVLDSEIYILKVLAKTNVELPESVTKEQYVKQLNAQLSERRLNTYKTTYLANHPIEVYADEIRPIYYKQQGNFERAIEAYYKLTSKAIQNPVPHFFIAELYSNMGKIEEALTEIAKADLKAELSVVNDFTELHLLYGDLLNATGKDEEALTQYEKSFVLSSNNIDGLELLKERYKKMKLSEKLDEVNQKITMLEEEKIQQQEALNELLQESSDQLN
ncbi:hypothetical protein DID76_00665 [Candidatus Marinamargulisbacteria bacterium SCGC AG-414-C22]|nr:hypothetical protein DID76_00665 [Candidatus Marinamargulisbacteria bacterium SCGC AG-414-C22]